jgi:hypothetical protein
MIILTSESLASYNIMIMDDVHVHPRFFLSVPLYHCFFSSFLQGRRFIYIYTLLCHLLNCLQGIKPPMATRHNQSANQPNKRTNTRSHQLNAAADGELFDLNVSDSSDNEETARQPRKRAQDAPEINQPLNDTTPAQDSKRAADIHHFFERQDDKNVCKVCK